MIDPGFIIKSVNVTGGYDFHQIFVTLVVFSEEDQMCGSFLSRVPVCHIARRYINFRSDNRRDSLLLAFAVKIHRTEHNAVIGQSESVRSLFPGCRDKIRDPAEAVKE